MATVNMFGGLSSLTVHERAYVYMWGCTHACVFLFPAPHAATKRSAAGARVSPDLQADSSPLEGSGAQAGDLPFQESALKGNTEVAVGSYGQEAK